MERDVSRALNMTLGRGKGCGLGRCVMERWVGNPPLLKDPSLRY